MDQNKNIGCLILVVFLAGLWFGGNRAKYEGYRAEYWFNQYDIQDGIYYDFRSCVEDYDSFSWEEKIKIGGVFYYCN